MSWDGND
jgi:hypothetical protein